MKRLRFQRVGDLCEPFRDVRPRRVAPSSFQSIWACRSWSKTCLVTGAGRLSQSIQERERFWLLSVNRPSIQISLPTALILRFGRAITSRLTSLCSTGHCEVPTHRARPTSHSWHWRRLRVASARPAPRSTILGTSSLAATSFVTPTRGEMVPSICIARLSCPLIPITTWSPTTWAWMPSTIS